MRDSKRIKRIISKVEELWKVNPDWRLTQLIMNVLNTNIDPYYIEDDELEKALDDFEVLHGKTRN